MSVSVLVSLAACSEDAVPSGTTAAEQAPAPFETFGATTVTVGAQQLRVLVAATPEQRSQGLRGVDDLGAFDGMLFVFGEPTDTGFTMAETPMPLEIGFYDEAGERVDRLEMVPCVGDDADCTVYRSSERFTRALETPAGTLPEGSLTT